MQKIKLTKSVSMYGDQTGLNLTLGGQLIWIPAKTVFQVQRGILSYTQKFYRKHITKTNETNS